MTGTSGTLTVSRGVPQHVEDRMHPHLLIFYFLGAVVFTLARLAYDEWRFWHDGHG